MFRSCKKKGRVTNKQIQLLLLLLRGEECGCSGRSFFIVMIVLNRDRLLLLLLLLSGSR